MSMTSSAAARRCAPAELRARPQATRDPRPATRDPRPAPRDTTVCRFGRRPSPASAAGGGGTRDGAKPYAAGAMTAGVIGWLLGRKLGRYAWVQDRFERHNIQALMDRYGFAFLVVAALMRAAAHHRQHLEPGGLYFRGHHRRRQLCLLCLEVWTEHGFRETGFPPWRGGLMRVGAAPRMDSYGYGGP